jgi:hypothetical protein
VPTAICSADDDHVARGDARHAAQQQTHAALGFFQVGGAGLDRHAARHLAHRRQQRQAAARAGDGFVGDADRAGFHQRRGLFRIGRQVQVGVQHLPFAQHRAFDRLRLLDLHDHVGAREDFLRRPHDAGAGRHVVLVRQPDPLTGALLHDDVDPA